MEQVRIQDDLYNAVNGEWLEQAVIPADRPTCGGFADLDMDVEKLLMQDLHDMMEQNTYPNEYLQKVCGLYRMILDTKKRNRQGAKPILKDLKRIANLTDMAGFNRHLVDFAQDGLPLPFSFSVDTDMKDSTRKIVYLQGPSTLLPDVSYYKPEMAQQKEMMVGLLTNIFKAIMAKTPLSPEEQESYIADTFAFDAVIATMVKSQEEWSEYPKMYNPVSSRRVATLLQPVRFSKLSQKLFGFVPQTVSLADPRFCKEFTKLFNVETLNQYKHWAYVTYYFQCCSYLSEELRDIGSSFRRALTGVAQMPSVDKFAYRLVGGIFSQPIGLYYGEKYFGEAAKKDITEMVYEIIDTYKKRVKENTFLAEATKEKAVTKLSTMRVKMGYPDQLEPIYDQLTFDENGSLYEALKQLEKIKRTDSFSKLKEAPDKSKWAMPGHMVNACYDPFSNDITFPAAILQPPFYSIKQTRSQNLGGIGAVIGHEISHAFDNNGAQCDENGNLANWWTKQDFKKFGLKTKAMIQQFQGLTLPFGVVNATLTVSENIADNGGMAVTLDIMSRLDGASYPEYFTNWAKVWCMKAHPEYQQLLLNVDVHAPVLLRANIPPRNFDAWYEAFGVTKKDKMYIAPAKRLIIW